MGGLFKYFPVDLYKVEKLGQHRIVLTPPKYFNDPWDFLVQREPITDDEINEQFEEFQAARPSSLTLEEFKQSITRPEFVEREGPDMQTGLSKMYGVVCLTSDPWNRLMWAYYADSHRGFVAEFTTGLKSDDVLGHETLVSPFGVAVKVRYEANSQKLKADFSNSLQAYTTKHLSWRHEDEWRVIELLAKAIPEPKDGKTFYLLSFRPQYLERIIFGLRVDPQLEKRLSEMLEIKEFAHVKKAKMRIDASSGQLICD